MNNFIQRLGIRYPIIQSPMAGVSTPALAAAVSDAGGLGSVAIGHLGPDAARSAIEAVRKVVKGPFNVNVFCHRPARRDADKEAKWLHHLTPLFQAFHSEPPQQLREIYRSYVADEALQEVIHEECPAVVSFHFGLPSAIHIRELQARGSCILATVTNLSEAVLAEQAEVDAIVAQGYEAGGHRGVFEPESEDEKLSTLELTGRLFQQTNLPIIAAGGIMDASDVTAAIASGASAVQVGTVFLLCPEVSLDSGYSAAIKDVSKRGTTMTQAISGRPARSVVNEFTKFGDTISSTNMIPDYPIAYDAGKSLRIAAEAIGNQQFGAQWAGVGAVKCEAIPAREVIARMVAVIPT